MFDKQFEILLQPNLYNKHKKKFNCLKCLNTYLTVVAPQNI